MTNELHRDKILMGAGVIAVSAGVYFPWLKTNPNLPSDADIPAIYYFGMNAGLEAFDYTLLSLVGLILVLHAVSSRKLLQSGFTLLTGVGTVVSCALYLAGPSLTGFTATFVPSLGWYLTVLGGVLLTVAGTLQLPAIIRRSETAATLID
ncbi:hypothetical protein VB773_21765 [Haloarculaceae archaeon H-GB2-1]|nr:hypothetical protein [Haloarculaceae archaeon H-GB1-1]MEA5409936.1 hypothetical protein [Haloarculaceae archaeon H-GB2-1]